MDQDIWDEKEVIREDWRKTQVEKLSRFVPSIYDIDLYIGETFGYLLAAVERGRMRRSFGVPKESKFVVVLRDRHGDSYIVQYEESGNQLGNHRLSFQHKEAVVYTEAEADRIAALLNKEIGKEVRRMPFGISRFAFVQEKTDAV